MNELIDSIIEEEIETAIEKFASSKPPVVLSTNWNRIKLLTENQRICSAGYVRIYFQDL
jgi:hypothetical protein